MLKFLLLIISLFFLSFVLKAQTKLEINKLCDNFYIYTTYQNYKGIMYPANGMYVVTSKGVVIIDSPWDTTQCQPLLDSIKIKHNTSAIMCIATHSHDDRTGGLEYYSAKGIKTFTTKMTDSICKINNERRAEYLIRTDTIFDFGSIKMKTIYAGAGHTKDNIAIWFSNEKVLYGGCMIKSTEAKDLGNIKDADLSQWPITLKKIKKYCLKPKFIIPGHQSWESIKSLDYTLQLLKQKLKS